MISKTNRQTNRSSLGGRFWKNALLMSAASLFMRTLGILFNAWWVEKTGTEALGLSSQIGGVFGFAVTLATSGIHLAVTRLVAEEEAKGPEKRTGSVLRTAWRFCLFTGNLACVVLLFFSEPIGQYLLRDGRIGRILRVMAFSLPAAAISSCLGGYLTAVRQVRKNAAVQLTAQLARMGFLILWIRERQSVPTAEEVCLILAFCGTVSEWIGAGSTALFFLRDRSRRPRDKSDYPGVRKVLLSNALPLACSSYVRSGLLALEHMLIPFCLIAHGCTRADALAESGVLQGMALPVVLFPTALIASFAGLLIPEFAELGTVGRNRIADVCDRVMTVTFFFSFAAAGLLTGLSEEIGTLLYGRTDVSRFIRLLAPLVPVMYGDSIVDAMLKGLGQQVFSMNVNIADAFLSVITVTLLLPRFGILGYVFVIWISELFNFALSLSRLIAITRWRPSLPSLLFLPLASTLLSTRSVAVLRRLLVPGAVITLPFVLLEAAITLAFFLLFATLLRGLKKNKKKLRKGVAFSETL